MTTETSNARGEVVAWEARDPDDGTRWVTRHASERDGWMGLGRTIRPLIYGDTPPPAAARGDVRGLVAKWRAEADEIAANNWTCNSNSIRARADELEAALTAEGVQAGEVEQRARELLAAELYARSLHEDAYPVAVGAVLDGVVAASVAAIASALSQQPEARGVVDGAMLERATRAYSAASIEGVMDLTALRAALTAALTGERNG